MMTAEIRNIDINLKASHKERFKTMTMNVEQEGDHLMPTQLRGLCTSAWHFLQPWHPSSSDASTLTDLTTEGFSVNSLLKGQHKSFINLPKTLSGTLSMKQGKGSSLDNWKEAGLSPPYLRLQKGYRQLSRKTNLNLATVASAFERRLINNNSEIVKALETKDFGNIALLEQLFANILACAILSAHSGKTGGKSCEALKHSSSGEYPCISPEKFSVVEKFIQLQLFSAKNQGVGDDLKSISFSNQANHAICGIKTTSLLCDHQQKQFVLNSKHDFQALSFWVYQVIVTAELVKRKFQAIQNLLYCVAQGVLSVRVLLFVVITIVEYCLQLQREGDALKKKRSLALFEKAREEKWRSYIERQPLEYLKEGRLVFQSREEPSIAEFAAFEGQMFAHNGVFSGEGGQGAMENAEAEVPFWNGGRNNEEQELEGEYIEIPDFRDEADEEEGDDDMMDIGDVQQLGFARRVQDFQVQHELRRVPSLDALVPEFMIEEEEHGHGHAHGQAAMLDGWANDLIINPGGIADYLRQIEENDPIPQQPEPPHGMGLPDWMEEPLFEVVMSAAANAA